MVSKQLLNKLKELNIEPESDIGLMLIKINNLYQSVDDINKLINYYNDKLIQLKEDIDVAETLFMYKCNKDGRIIKWGKNGF